MFICNYTDRMGGYGKWTDMDRAQFLVSILESRKGMAGNWGKT